MGINFDVLSKTRIREQEFLSALLFISLGFFIWSALLGYKQYINFEYGKFDLGNMSQTIWNTAHGNFYTVTDQFGTTTSRLAMSHFDPILLMFVPIFAIFAHPLILVFSQQFVIISGALAIFLLVQLRTKSQVVSFFCALTYLFYPAVGYILVWTEFHGISFVAPLFLWFVYYLEKNNFFQRAKKTACILPVAFLVVLLIGKEEIGLMLAIYAVYLFFKNRSLGILFFLISLIWFVVGFFVLIPQYKEERAQSLSNFIQFVGRGNVIDEEVGSKNFFENRYSYLGGTYREMASTIFLHPGIVASHTPLHDNVKTLITLLLPFGLIAVVVPYWLIALPDLAIVVLSSDPIFSISNHRISFLISTFFLGYLGFVTRFVKRIEKRNASIQRLPILFTCIVFCITVVFTITQENPLFTPFIRTIGRVLQSTAFAREETKFAPTLPENSIQCLHAVQSYVLKKNPQRYSGPDYLGAQTSLRYTNAVFPTAIENADIFVADVLEDKAFEPLDSAESWTLNKGMLQRVYTQLPYIHVMSCDRMAVFERANDRGDRDTSVVIPESELTHYQFTPLRSKQSGLNIAVVQLPSRENGYRSVMVMQRERKNDMKDKLTYWGFVDEQGNTFTVVDYAAFSLDVNINAVNREDALKIEQSMPYVASFISGNVKVHYGFSNQVDGAYMYLGDTVL